MKTVVRVYIWRFDKMKTFSELSDRLNDWLIDLSEDAVATIPISGCTALASGTTKITTNKNKCLFTFKEMFFKLLNSLVIESINKMGVKLNHVSYL